MTLLHQAAQKAVEALNHIVRRLQMDIDDGGRPDQWSMEDLVRKAQPAIDAVQSALQQPQQATEPAWGITPATLNRHVSPGITLGHEMNRLRQYDAAALQHQEVPREPVGERISDERILHLWDTHVGDPSAKYPLSDFDKLEFARTVLRAAVLAPSTTRQQEVGSDTLAVVRKALAELAEGYNEANCAMCKGRGFYGIPGGRCTFCDGKGRVRWRSNPAPSTPENAGGVKEGGDAQP